MGHAAGTLAGGRVATGSGGADGAGAHAPKRIMPSSHKRADDETWAMDFLVLVDRCMGSVEI
jgi:hypothetical protein